MEVSPVQQQIKRAQKIGLPASLTEEQWQATLVYFHYRCAYCNGPYEVLEHFVPLNMQGGTTSSNCVPACTLCNVCKDHPTRLLFSSNQKAVDAFLRVKRYLQSVAPEEFNETQVDAYIEYQRTRVPIIYARKSQKSQSVSKPSNNH